MISPKETIMMALAVTGTVFGITSTALHFVPQLHSQNNNSTVVMVAPQDIVELPYTIEELEKTKNPQIVNVNGDVFPKFVHIKGEPHNILHPINFLNTTSTSEAITWATFEYQPGKTLQICLTKNIK